MVDGDGEGRLVVVRVLLHHLGQTQLPHIVLGHGHTDQPFAVGGHEVDVLRGGKLRRADEVPFVLSFRVIGDQDQLALSQILQGFRNGIELDHVLVLLKSAAGQQVPCDGALFGLGRRRL